MSSKWQRRSPHEREPRWLFISLGILDDDPGFILMRRIVLDSVSLTPAD
ncbi:MAG: hypothetical protein WAV05_15000 [Anaerolineales bacterium]